jgi:hypothetical protein
MKNFIRRSENWLLITPILFSISALVSGTGNDVDIHFHDTYYIVGNYYLLLLFLGVLIVPFLVHKLLRRYRKKARIIPIVHVFATIVYIAVLYILVYNSELQKPGLNFENASFPLVALLEKLLFSFLLLQLLFVAYALVILSIGSKVTGTGKVIQGKEDTPQKRRI